MYDSDSPRVKTGSKVFGGEMKELREGEDGTNIVGIKEVIASVREGGLLWSVIM